MTSNQRPTAARPARRGVRVALVGLSALLAWALAGCGDPDDGDSGGGYVSQQAVASQLG
jgi:hypothetical protein